MRTVFDSFQIAASALPNIGQPDAGLHQRCAFSLVRHATRLLLPRRGH
ncbi:MAG: hypothetical protein AB1697_02485 [Pseudomonadota bacterium]